MVSLPLGSTKTPNSPWKPYIADKINLCFYQKEVYGEIYKEVYELFNLKTGETQKDGFGTDAQKYMLRTFQVTNFRQEPVSELRV